MELQEWMRNSWFNHFLHFEGWVFRSIVVLYSTWDSEPMFDIVLLMNCSAC